MEKKQETDTGKCGGYWKGNFLNKLRIIISAYFILLIVLIKYTEMKSLWVQFGAPLVYHFHLYSGQVDIVNYIKYSILLIPALAVLAVWKPSRLSYCYLLGLAGLEVVNLCSKAYLLFIVTVMSGGRGGNAVGAQYILTIATWIALLLLLNEARKAFKEEALKKRFGIEERRHGAAFKAMMYASAIGIVLIALAGQNYVQDYENKYVMEEMSQEKEKERILKVYRVIGSNAYIFPDETRYASYETTFDKANYVNIYDIKTGERVKLIKTPGIVGQSFVTPNNRYIVIGFEKVKLDETQKLFMVYDLEKDKEVEGFILPGNEKRVAKNSEKRGNKVMHMGLSCNLSGKYLMVTGSFGKEIWELETGKLVKRYPEYGENGKWVKIVEWINDEEYFYFSREKVYLGKIGEEKLFEKVFYDCKWPYYHIKVNAKEQTVFIYGEDRIKLFDIKTGRELFSKVLDGRPEGVALSKDGKKIACLQYHAEKNKVDMTLIFFDIGTKTQKEFSADKGQVMIHSMQFLDNDKTLVVTNNSKIVFYDLAKFE